MKHSFLRWLAISGGMGLLAPIAWFSIQAVAGGNAQLAYPLERVVLVVCPSSFWLMATVAPLPSSFSYSSSVLLQRVLNFGLVARW